MHADPKSAKKTVKLSSFFVLLGSALIKAARRMLVKLTQGVCVCVCLYCSAVGKVVEVAIVELIFDFVIFIFLATVHTTLTKHTRK